ncbi:MAG: zinc ribbon domain-containing protein [Treponema sp.]|nr:zinc ribbon domain-containing protein [Treponema sp.]
MYSNSGFSGGSVGVSVCQGCGRTIQKDYLYCPWCGYSKVSENKTSEDSLDAMFTKFAQLKKDSRRKQLSAMEQKLDDMDKELSVLVLSAEMHK